VPETSPIDRLAELVRRAEQGDAAALPEARALFDHDPRLWREAGDLARAAELAVVGLCVGHNDVLQEAAARQAEALRAELLAAGDSPLERLLAQNIVLAWLQLAHLDLLACQAGGVAPAQRAVYGRGQAQAARRLHAAAEGLARLRRLLRPPVSPLRLALGLGEERAAAPAALRGRLAPAGAGAAN
jgi:hypothetical protein